MLGEIGNADALLVRELPDKRLMLIDGHLRAETMPNEQIPVLVLNVNEEEADKLLATVDPLVGMASADGARLNELLESFRSDSPAVLALLDHIRADEGLLLERLHALGDPEPQIDKAKELRDKWGTALGQLWDVGPHRLVCGDAQNSDVVGHLWDHGQQFRMLWCDPPYGVDYSAKNELLNKTDRGNRIQKPIENDALGPDAVSSLFRESLKQGLAFAAKGAACYASVPSGSAAAALHRGVQCFRLLVQTPAGLGQAAFRLRHVRLSAASRAHSVWMVGERSALFHSGSDAKFSL
jgi:hypothetical protein